MIVRSALVAGALTSTVLVPLAAQPAAASRPAPPTTSTQQTFGTFVSDDGRFTLTLTRGQAGRLRVTPVPRADGSIDAGFLRQEYRTSWGWVTGTIYFNKRETSLLVSASNIGWFATLLPPPFNGLLPFYAAWIGATSATAKSQGRCTYVRSNGLVGSYRGAWCSGTYT